MSMLGSLEVDLDVRPRGEVEHRHSSLEKRTRDRQGASLSRRDDRV